MLILVVALMGSVPPMPVQTAIKTAIGKKLADPYSAQYDWQPIKNETVYCGWVNAKNQFGAYTGYQPFMVLYSITGSGKPLIFSSDLTPNVVTAMCLEKGYRLSH